jgi:hypothetical protein
MRIIDTVIGECCSQLKEEVLATGRAKRRRGRTYGVVSRPKPDRIG